jgi:hypothetical protein
MSSTCGTASRLISVTRSQSTADYADFADQGRMQKTLACRGQRSFLQNPIREIRVIRGSFFSLEWRKQECMSTRQWAEVWL